MNWDAVGAIAEVVASVGVIVSLIYLAIQIRAQTEEKEVSTTSETVSMLDAWYQSISGDEVLASIFVKGLRDFEDLNSVETVRFNFLMVRFFWMGNAITKRRQMGHIDDSTFEGMMWSWEGLCKYPGVRAWWSTREQAFDSEFRAFVSKLMAREGKPQVYDWQHLRPKT